MLTSLEIQNFKAFRHLKIERLAKVNLFVGEGNSGKTSVLEALRLLPVNDTGPNKTFSHFRNSGATTEPTDWQRWLPNHLTLWKGILISAAYKTKGHGNERIVTQINQKGRGRLDGVFKYKDDLEISWNMNHMQVDRLPTIAHVATRPRSPSELAKAFDLWTLRDGNEERIATFAQTIDANIAYLRPKEHTGVRMLYASIGLPELIPLPLLGEGLNRLIEIYGAIIGEGANIVLIDEIENGLHWKALPKVWQGIKAVVDAEDVQIFATTHSIECIEAASEVFKGPPDDFAVHRLERRNDGEIHCVTMGEQELGRMLERGWEVR